MLPRVTIYLPTYKNEGTTAVVIKSFLDQTYKNIQIKIFDNGASVGAYKIRNFISSLNDTRVLLHENITQIGHRLNYGQILSSVDPNSLAMILPSDYGLAPNAIQRMVEILLGTNSSIVYTSCREYDIRKMKNKVNFSFANSSFIEVNHGDINTSKLSSVDVLKKFYSDENINGEFNGYSIFGSLFEGNLLSNFPSEWSGFAGHGFEQFLSLSLLLRSESVYYCNENLLYNIIGVPRIGGTERLESDIYRIDCIMATQRIIEDYSILLESKGIDVDELRLSQIEKARYFLKHYSGFRKYALRIIHANQFMVAD